MKAVDVILQLVSSYKISFLLHWAAGEAVACVVLSHDWTLKPGQLSTHCIPPN